MAVSLCLSLPNHLAKIVQDEAHKAGTTSTALIRDLVRSHFGEPEQ